MAHVSAPHKSTPSTTELYTNHFVFKERSLSIKAGLRRAPNARGSCNPVFNIYQKCHLVSQQLIPGSQTPWYPLTLYHTGLSSCVSVTAFNSCIKVSNQAFFHASVIYGMPTLLFQSAGSPSLRIGRPECKIV